MGLELLREHRWRVAPLHAQACAQPRELLRPLLHVPVLRHQRMHHLRGTAPFTVRSTLWGLRPLESGLCYAWSGNQTTVRTPHVVAPVPVDLTRDAGRAHAH